MCDGSGTHDREQCVDGGSQLGRWDWHKPTSGVGDNTWSAPRPDVPRKLKVNRRYRGKSPGEEHAFLAELLMAHLLSCFCELVDGHLGSLVLLVEMPSA